tara:strand:- start:5494 stop:5700 length:207 start_codon:yes stop_codon:yes gene_type:complete
LEFSRIDSSYSFNTFGLYLSGLSKFTKEDKLIQPYVEARQIAGDISPSLIINEYLQEDYDYNNLFLKE